MTVIDITHPKEIPSAWYGYLGMSEMDARALCREKYNLDPEVIYRKVRVCSTGGRVILCAMMTE